MQWQERLVVERDGLNDRLQRLRVFIAEGRLNDLDATDRKLLVEQEQVMNRYLFILNQRIGRFDA